MPIPDGAKHHCLLLGEALESLLLPRRNNGT